MAFTNILLDIKAVSFLGSPLTADGIMSVLEDHRPGEDSCLLPGIWSSAEDVNRPIGQAGMAPYYAKSPTAGTAKSGLYDSIHATGAWRSTRRYNETRLMEPRPTEPCSRSAGACLAKSRLTELRQVESRPVEARSDEPLQEAPTTGINLVDPVRTNLSVLLLRIDQDLCQQFRPLLYRYWSAEVRGNNYPRFSDDSLKSTEIALWKVLEFNFDTVYPNRAVLRQKVRNGDLAFNWDAWGCWANPDLGTDRAARSSKPTFADLAQFIQEWEILWAGLLQYAEEWDAAKRYYSVAVTSWKMMAQMLEPHLSGGN
jgi:hypothetical protein